MPSNHLILCNPLLFLPSIFSSIRLFSSESVLRIRWPKYWSSSFSVSPSSEHSGLVSLGWTGWISVLSKEPSRVFSNTTVQRHQFSPLSLSGPTLTLIHDYWKTVALTRHTFVEVCHSFPSKEQASLNVMAAVIDFSDFGAQEKKSVTASTLFPSIFHEMMVGS